MAFFTIDYFTSRHGTTENYNSSMSNDLSALNPGVLIFFVLFYPFSFSHLQKRKLDAVYYYMRSLAASNPILTAKESLMSLFEEAKRKVRATLCAKNLYQDPDSDIKQQL